MSDTIHIVFGSESHRANYARAKAVNPIYVVRATLPEKIQPLMTDNIKTIKLIRFSVFGRGMEADHVPL